MNHPLASALLIIISCGWMSFASAQVFYEPVQYQFGSGAGTFYYGGRDGRMLDYAASTIRSHEYSSVVTSRHVVEQSHVYSDSFRFSDGADNAYTGYSRFTANDARNEANQNVPRYFRKSELLNAAVAADDGSWVVPAQARPVVDIRVVRPFGTTTGPAVPKGTILVIPKKWLEKPVKNGTPSVVMNER